MKIIQTISKYKRSLKIKIHLNFWNLLIPPSLS